MTMPCAEGKISATDSVHCRMMRCRLIGLVITVAALVHGAAHAQDAGSSGRPAPNSGVSLVTNESFEFAGPYVFPGYANQPTGWTVNPG
jgi:hypothetical protein